MRAVHLCWRLTDGLEGERQQFDGGEGGTELAQVWKWEVTGVLVAPAWALRWLELDPLSGLP